MEASRLTRPKPVVMEGVRILFRNFAGREGPYNAAGAREFSVELDEGTAHAMEADGWNVKWPKPRAEVSEEEDTRQPTLPIKVSFKNRPPLITIISSKGHRVFDEELVDLIDDFEILDGVVDLAITPYLWDFNGKQGISAYLQKIYITIVEDPLTAKYGLPGKAAEGEGNLPF